MDAFTLSTIANVTVSLLGPYLKIMAEGLAKKAGEEVGKVASGVVLSKAKQLYNAVKAKFSTQPTAGQALDRLVESPDDRNAQTAVEDHLKKTLASDEQFAKELIDLLEQAAEADADTAFHTNVYGRIQKLVQIGSVYGDVNL